MALLIAAVALLFALLLCVELDARAGALPPNAVRPVPLRGGEKPRRWRRRLRGDCIDTGTRLRQAG